MITLFKVSPYTINKFYRKYQSISTTAYALGITEDEVRTGLAKMEQIQRHNAEIEAQRKAKPPNLFNSFLSTISILGFIFFPITLAISFVFSPPKHKKRKF